MGPTAEKMAGPVPRRPIVKTASLLLLGDEPTAPLAANLTACARAGACPLCRCRCRRRFCCLLTHGLEDFDQLVLVAAAAEERPARHHLGEDAADAETHTGTHISESNSKYIETRISKWRESSGVESARRSAAHLSCWSSPPNVHLRRVLCASHQDIRRSGKVFGQRKRVGAQMCGRQNLTIGCLRADSE